MLLIASVSNVGNHLLLAVFLLYGCAIAFALTALFLKTKTVRKTLFLAKVTVLTAAVFAVVMLILLAAAFLTDDFSLILVSHFSSKELPFFYKISALWASPAGSFLLWSVLVFVIFVFWQITNRKKLLAINGTQSAVTDEQLAKIMLRFDILSVSIGSAICLAFSALLMLFAKPFAVNPQAIADGSGLKAVLQNFWVIIHPPLLFIGYAAFLIPLVFILASIFAGVTNGPDIYKPVRRWLLFGICSLTLGIATGARWSYLEPNWGGFWTWDPMQNVSLLPWFLAVAALHSLVGMQVSDRFRFWAITFAPLPFILCLFAAFVTRSGILVSMHALVERDMSLALSALIACCSLLWLICIIRATKITSVSYFQPNASRLGEVEPIFWGNAVLIFAAVAISVATFWPVIWQLLTRLGLDITFPPLFYNHVALVIGLILAFLIGLATLIDLQEYRIFIISLLGSCAAALIGFGLVFRFVQRSILLVLASGICAFSSVAVLMKLVLNLSSSRKLASGLAHFGLLILIAAVGFSTDKQAKQIALNKGQKANLGEYELLYNSFRQKSSDGITQQGPEIILTKKDLQKNLWPHNNLYPNGQSTSEVAIHTALLEDVYLTFDGISQDGGAIITARLKPFMLWVWLAALLIAAGLALALLRNEEPTGRKQKSKTRAT